MVKALMSNTTLHVALPLGPQPPLQPPHALVPSGSLAQSRSPVVVPLCQSNTTASALAFTLHGCGNRQGGRLSSADEASMHAMYIHGRLGRLQAMQWPHAGRWEEGVAGGTGPGGACMAGLAGVHGAITCMHARSALGLT